MDERFLPEELRQPIDVVIRSAEFKGTRQFQGRHGKYKIVLDTSFSRRMTFEDGEMWSVRPHRITGTIVFCIPEVLKLNAHGIHPLIAATQRYVDGCCKVTIYLAHTGRIEEQIHAFDVLPNDWVRITFMNGRTYDVRHFRGSAINHGRYEAKGSMYGSQVRIVFWEFQKLRWS